MTLPPAKTLPIRTSSPGRKDPLILSGNDRMVCRRRLHELLAPPRVSPSRPCDAACYVDINHRVLSDTAFATAGRKYHCSRRTFIALSAAKQAAKSRSAFQIFLRSVFPLAVLRTRSSNEDGLDCRTRIIARSYTALPAGDVPGH